MDINTIFETPFDADTYIEDWLLSIGDEDERAFARKHLAGSLKAMIRHTEQSYQALEDRVYAEVKGRPGRHSIYITVVDRGKYDITNGQWFPVLPGDERDLWRSGMTMSETLPFTIDRLYCAGDETAIAALNEASNKEFQGTVTAGDRNYHAAFRLIQCAGYMGAAERTYGLFQKNALPWVTLNCGYLLRFFSCTLVSADGVSPGQEIQSYTVDWEGLEGLLTKNLLPVWNVQPLSYDSERFVSPAIDTLYFEHIFPMERFGMDDGYLLEGNQDILSFRHTEDEILIMTLLETFQKWRAHRIINNPDMNLYCFERPILHNAVKDNFVSGYTKDSGMLLRSKLEMMRKMNEYDLSGYLKPVDVQLLTDTTEEYFDQNMSVMNVSPADNMGHEYVKYLNLNWFLQDDLINRDEQKVLLFQFTRENDDPLWHDALSFVMSELQRQFTEYRCEAEVVAS